MLRKLLPVMENHHNVSIREEAINAAVYLSDRYLTGRQQPDKSVSLLDTACSRVIVSQTGLLRLFRITAQDWPDSRGANGSETGKY